MAKAISVRLPWHDSGWNGEVCKNPSSNDACKIIRLIADKRGEEDPCVINCGKRRTESDSWLPPCARESGYFLSTEPYTFTATHPFTFNDRFNHILPTKINVPAKSFVGIPYGWFLKPDSEIPNSPHRLYCTGYDDSIEQEDFRTSFISNGVNQKSLLEYFWRDIEPENSLVIAYAKSVPFTDSGDRVIVALSSVKELGSLSEYSYSQRPDGKRKHEAWAWERAISHNLCEKDPTGFVVPFQQIQEYVKKHPETNIDELLFFAPAGFRRDFSYGCEHISPDALILTLNRAIELLKTWNRLGIRPTNGIPWSRHMEWCEQELEKAWKERGQFPGLAALLSSLGLRYAYDVVPELFKRFPGSQLWKKLPEIFASKKALASFLPESLKTATKNLTAAQLEEIQYQLNNNNTFFKLLARINLTPHQAGLILNTDSGDKYKNSIFKRFCPIFRLSRENLENNIRDNPYILYEDTRFLTEDYIIGINQIDLAFFPPEKIADEWFDEDDIRIEDSDDKRRIRALITNYLEIQATKGNTFMPEDKVIAYCENFRPDLPGMNLDNIRIQARSLERNNKFYEIPFIFSGIDLLSSEGEETRKIIKLKRLEVMDELIRKEVARRIHSQIPGVQEDWDKILNAMFGAPKNDRSRRSHSEQKEAIEKLARSPISVLTGGAGTGKTSTLRALCHSKAIQAGRILILAPTGKARVVLSSQLQKDGINHEAKTVFAFLNAQKRSDIHTYRSYLSTSEADRQIPETVIIDESSMLTEEMMAALMQSLIHARRIIFAGDPDQLPPIGAGKPFYELCKELEKETGQPHFACLSIKNRNQCAIGDIFKSAGKNIRSEEIAALLSTEDGAFKVISCVNPEDIEKKLIQALEEVFDSLDLAGSDAVRFDLSLGGEKSGVYMNFNNPQGVDTWQILTPWRNNNVYGSRRLNSIIHTMWGIQEDRGDGYKKRKTPLPMGRENIHFGEKVINLRNKDWKKNKPVAVGEALPEASLCYTANGETGIISRLEGSKWNFEKGARVNLYHGVQYASQPGYIYKYFSSSGGEESDPDLELAYALTIHKAQGSGFGYTILVLFDEGERPSPFLSREMLYTAMTRQKEKLIIITNRAPEDLIAYASQSELECRMTNLFQTKMLDEPGSGWHDERLIHRAKDGVKVRSKSELVIYNELLNAGLNPVYEPRLNWEDGKALPDFMIAGSDKRIYWEHLGMMGNPGYVCHWHKKLMLYERHGISEAAGNLVISEDDPVSGSLDAVKIARLISEIKNRLA